MTTNRYGLYPRLYSPLKNRSLKELRILKMIDAISLLLKEGAAFLVTSGPEEGQVAAESKIESLRLCLGLPVRVGEEFTIGDLFRFVERDFDFFAQVFCAELGFHSLDAYRDEWQKTSDAANMVSEQMEYIEVRYTIENDAGTSAHLYLSGSMDGVGSIAESRHGDSAPAMNDPVRWGLDFLPLHEIARYPLRLNNEVVWLHGSGSAEVLSQRRYRMDFTLHMMLAAVFRELSFYGPPSRRDEALEELKNRR